MNLGIEGDSRRSGLFWALLILLVALLAVLNFPGGVLSNRTFIDYDDLEVVTKLFKLDLKQYFWEWLPDRRHYAFPLRDLTLFLDRFISTQTDDQFWISNFLYFSITLVVFGVVIEHLFRKNPLLMVSLVSLYALHPLQTEVIQWITCRKYLVGMVPLAFGTLLVVRWKNHPLDARKIALLCSLWILSLLSYPTASFWIFWALYFVERDGVLRRHWKLFLSLAAIALLYLLLVGHGTGEVNSSLGSIFRQWQKSFHFGYNAVGRGFTNFVFPFWTFPFYRENHPLTFLGLGLLTLVSWLLFRTWRVMQSAEKQNPEFFLHFREATIWFVGGLVFLIPIANTILGFFDFMLADRHFFFSLPFFIISLGHLTLAFVSAYRLDGPKFKVIAMACLGSWILVSCLSTSQKVPLWNNDFTLMKNCAQNEKAARCFSQAIRRKFFKSDCEGVKDVILGAAEIYHSRPPYAFEFISEVPFFHASCIALNATLTPEKKLRAIEGLDQTYQSSPEIVFALVLATLESGNLNGAFDVASGYYLGPLSMGPIPATRTLQSVYAGQISALCNLRPSDLCSARLKHFLTLHGEANPQTGAGAWGREATLLMARRGRLF